MKTTAITKDKLTPPPIGSRWLHAPTGHTYTVCQSAGWHVTLEDREWGKVVVVEIAALRGSDYTQVG